MKEQILIDIDEYDQLRNRIKELEAQKEPRISLYYSIDALRPYLYLCGNIQISDCIRKDIKNLLEVISKDVTDKVKTMELNIINRWNNLPWYKRLFTEYSRFL